MVVFLDLEHFQQPFRISVLVKGGHYKQWGLRVAMLNLAGKSLKFHQLGTSNHKVDKGGSETTTEQG